ncbi:alpha-L-arabinofuranosidase [Chitinophagaceae bacterium LWZ2-11]
MFQRNILIAFFITLTVAGFAQNSQGFFLDDFQPKHAEHPKHEKYTLPVSQVTTTVTVNFQDTIARVSKYLFGNNSNTWMSQMVTQKDLMNNLKLLQPNILRYPGGNISNVFFWDRENNDHPNDVPNEILYADQKPDYKLWYGKNNGEHTLSVDNYYSMLQETKSTGIICINYAYARYGMSNDPVTTAAHYAANWVRYDKGRTKYWELGNENFGAWQPGYLIDQSKNKDGQPKYISGDLYGKHFKVFADSMHAAAKEIGSILYLGAVLEELPRAESYATTIDKNWNEGFFRTAGNAADFFAIHCYYTPYNKNSSVDVILNSAKPVSSDMMSYMQQLSKQYNIQPKPIALSEWNIFAVGSKQMTSYISGVHATLVLGELIKNKYGMASRWDLANAYDNGNDMGMFSQGDEPDVPKWNPRPAFYYMYYFQKIFGDHMVSAKVSGNDSVVVYASSFASGEAGIVAVNKSKRTQTIKININNFKPGKRFYLYNLTGGDDNGNFSTKVFINGKGTEFASGGPAKPEHIKALSASGKEIKFEAAPNSVQFIMVEK